MSETIRSPCGDASFAEAAAWHAKLADDASDQVRTAFEAWRASAPQHALAYAELQETQRLACEAADAPPILVLRHETLTRLIVPRRRVGAAAAAAVVAAIALGTSIWLLAGRVALTRDRIEAASAEARIYQTGVGERLTVGLADGSTAVLNTATRLRVAYSDKERRLVIEAGEALFQVAKNQTRPFVVTAADRDIIAHGTEFDVKVSPEQLIVALLEGVVSVRRQDAADASEVHLQPHDMLIAEGETVTVHAIADIRKLAGWREGLVFFRNVNLAEAAAEMNRYVDRPKIQVQPSVANLRLSGAFRTGQTANFADALAQGFAVEIVERSQDNIVLGPAPTPH